MKGEKKKRLIPCLLLILTALACEDEKESLFVVGLQGRTDVLRPLLSVKASAPGWRIELKGPEITSAAIDNYSEEYRTPTRGTLRVDVGLRVESRKSLLVGPLELDLRPDWAWSVDVWLGEGKHARACFGCIGVLAFAVPDDLIPETADSLFLTWAGGSISNPVIY